jgi:hypothetical protein
MLYNIKCAKFPVVQSKFLLLHQKRAKFDVVQSKFPLLHQRCAKFDIAQLNSHRYVKSALTLGCVKKPI